MLNAPLELIACRPGDVVVTERIRFVRTLGLPDLSENIAIVDHVDPNGIVWAIEGRPYGVGWVDASTYFTGQRTFTNRRQLKSSAQRVAICHVTAQLLKISGDWDAAAKDAYSELEIPHLWKRSSPAVVCASLVQWVYLRAKLSAPSAADPRLLSPSDWMQFIRTEGWKT